MSDGAELIHEAARQVRAVSLPILAEPEAERATGPGAKPETRERHRVLIADDNEDAAESLAMLVRTMGHEAATANDGVAALELAETGRFDIAVLDIGMPRLNGYELTRRIREQAWGRDLYVVALTGWGQEADRRRAMEAGFDAHLTKPVEPERVARLLAGPRPNGP
jgi:CheY-like chemotaxis protein